MKRCFEQRGGGVASCSTPSAVFLPCRLAKLQGRKCVSLKYIVSVAQLGQVQTEVLTSTRQGTSAGQISRLSRQGINGRPIEKEPALPLYTCLDGDILTPANKFAYYEALRSGLKALRALGINGICVDVYWGIVEGVRPRDYDWSSYKQLFALIRDEGFMAQVCLCFHATDTMPLPTWLVEEGRTNPDIFYTDRAGQRCTNYVSLGADEAPVLAGRTPLECYRDLMTSFRRELGPFFGSTILDVLVGLGPDGELKYPAHPRDKRWNFPGVGEFQCYDKYMLSVLRACAQQVNQPSWGLRGPHDAGTYCVWPHQTGFFHQRGNWSSPYGKFFLQWYSDMLVQHADAVLGIAREVLLEPETPYTHYEYQPPYQRLHDGESGTFRGGGRGSGSDGDEEDGGGVVVMAQAPDAGAGISLLSQSLPPAIRLHAKLPSIYWWYADAHAPELTAGYYNTASRDGYMPIMHVLARNGVSVRLQGGEPRGYEMNMQAHCAPDRQLTQQRTVAAALQVPVGLENLSERFDEQALFRLEGALFDTSVVKGIELPQVQSLVFNRMCDSMFEPGNWNRFKQFVRRVRSRAQTLVVPDRGSFIGSSGVLRTPPGAPGAVNLPAAAAGQWVAEPSGSSGKGGALQLA
ncbi:hypothetical protein Vafri_16696 [Volvox africanus]|uniref:Beta-amylase n=1 Tax=Volvox africanus TaxID=51714 RepID=A0A8J4BHY3_9CHLO|nr:hypothetical protein Vafri_16696 [Volvox africanus]